jgi:molybdopterin molybdotransferase
MLTMIGASEAHGLVLQHARPRDALQVSVAESLGLVLARAVFADRDYPPFDRATMDGFAVHVAHAGKTVAVRGEVRPGALPSVGPDDSGCVEIMTGSPCPAGTEAVVMKEEVRRQGREASLPPRIAAGQNIVRAGTECRSGATVLPEGSVLTPLAQGLLAAVGQPQVWARALPSVALLITGDEVVHGGERPGDVEIRDSNGPMLAAMACASGLANPTRLRVRDTPEALAAALASSSADVVVLTGGVSAGNCDLVPAALASHGVTIVFHKVRQQPGKPILFGVKGPRLFFGLPGTPLGSHLGFHRYVLPAVRSLAGLSPLGHEDGRIVAAWSTRSDRQQFLLAKAKRGSDAWDVTLLSPKGSSDLFTPWEANAYVSVPEGTRAFAAGAAVSFEWLAS